MPKVTIDNRTVDIPEGTTILEAARLAGVSIPTLCYLEGVQTMGACRVCLVEIEGAKNLVASCVTPVSDGMKVNTKSRRVRNARRTVVELLLSDHEGDCRTCDRSGSCELQSLAEDLGIREIHHQGEKHAAVTDYTTPALVRDTGKCILCRRCVSVCNEIQGVGALFPQDRGFDTVVGPAFSKSLDEVVCVQCGQCSAVCPVGAISEKDEVQEVWGVLDDPEKFVVVQTAPAIRAALGECFGYPPGTLVTGKMVRALRLLGFDRVFDTEFAADLTIMEEGTELLVRLKKALVEKEEVALPQFTSCCPAWIKYVEHFHPELLANISSCKSPQQMFGAVTKTYFADQIGKRPEDITVVSIMPCTAKKYENKRPEMYDSSVQDVDIVLTTRELGRLIKESGIDFTLLDEDVMDDPLGRCSTGAADVFANTGGVMEAALRTAYEIVTGEPLPFDGLHIEPIAGLDGVKEAEVRITKTVPEWAFLKGKTLKVAVAHGLANAKRVIRKIQSGESRYHFVEVMACPGGCIGGGGQPRFTTNEIRKKRIDAIYKEDEKKTLRKSHENPEVIRLYEEFLGEPLGERSHHLLHTSYDARSRV
ncbi:MAG: iron hydrogenase small subunit [Spirochaetes bacterium]|nr:iron hydrogenase small subunit [Spirochaetota bacterium]